MHQLTALKSRYICIDDGLLACLDINAGQDIAVVLYVTQHVCVVQTGLLGLRYETCLDLGLRNGLAAGNMHYAHLVVAYS